MAHIAAGPNGGFSEARPYTTAHLFICVRQRTDAFADALKDRATRSLNNAIDLYRFLTMDPRVRRLDWASDTYCTVVSVADVPRACAGLPPIELLRKVGVLRFGSGIGKDRVQTVGLNSYEEYLECGAPLDGEQLRLFADHVQESVDLEIHHVLFLSAIRRLKRREYALAVVDAQSAFEAVAALILRDALTAQGRTPAEIARAFGRRDKLRDLQRRLVKLDAIAQSATHGSFQPFLGSTTEKQWRSKLSALRNRVVHEGVRQVSFSEARDAVSAGLAATDALQGLCPSFGRRLPWTGSIVDLKHIEETAGRLFRVFEY